MAFLKYIVLTILILFSSTVYAEEKDELKCLVEAVYHEARSESFVGQLAVANVIIERTTLQQYPDTICGVVHAGHRWKGNIIKNRCVAVMSTLGATHYHASYVFPDWSVNMLRLEQIGTHIFYLD
jgi:spore germination cell wall hydrolase CwlJ-like protein